MSNTIEERAKECIRQKWNKNDLGKWMPLMVGGNIESHVLFAQQETNRILDEIELMIDKHSSYCTCGVPSRVVEISDIKWFIESYKSKE